MTEKFDTQIDRSGTCAEKYDSREHYFHSATAEPFWVADMDLPCAPFIVEAISKRAMHPVYGYTGVDEKVYESIIWWMEVEHGVCVEKDDILLSPSVVTSFAMALLAKTKENEKVVIISPVYGPFYSIVRNNNRDVIDIHLIFEEGKYQFDFRAILEAFSDKKTTMVVLCNPQNPSGRLHSAEELQIILDMAKDNNVTVFCDEIHSDIVFPEKVHTSVLSLRHSENVIVAHSTGKTFNTSGLNTSFLIIPGILKSSLTNMQLRLHTGEVNLFGKIAITAAFTPEGREYKNKVVAYIHENIKQCVEILLKLEKLQIVFPEAGYLLWIDFSYYGSEDFVSNLLIKEANVILSNGSFFGPPGFGWFRLNCAHPRPVLLSAVERIYDVFSQQPEH
ncbi:PatB family C-S lyase [Myxococcota bacterium]|nr:PatB family C-S lyase [Myxococcota bacterium]MBU1380011.1 PatB family C-S lyase [Myxococcota bacterium]MBU1496042.1 PatB family C-S lyase [Myxococcota bacterium]